VCVDPYTANVNRMLQTQRRKTKESEKGTKKLPIETIFSGGGGLGYPVRA